MKPKLSICMMVKDEERNLRRCLNSILPIMKEFSSELIIVDTGSEDNTVEIAKEYTDKVFFHKWNNNFSEMRNISISYAKGEWIFIIDADEEMESLDGLRAFLSKPQHPPIAAAGIIVKSLSNSEDLSRYATILSPRVFRRTPAFRYDGIVHNVPKVEGTMVDIGDSLLHYGYQSDDKELMERKFQRTTTLLKEQLRKNPKNIYYQYQLGVSFAMNRDWKVALTQLKKARDLCGDNNGLMKEHIYVFGMLMFAYVMNDITEDEVLEVGFAGLSVEPDFVDIHFFLAQTYIKRKEFTLAKHHYQKYLDILENINNSNTVANPLITYYTLQSQVEAVYNLANIYMGEKNYREARLWLFKVIENYIDRPEFVAQARRGIVQLDCEFQDFTDSSKLYDELVVSEKYVELKQLEGFMETQWCKMSTKVRGLFSKAFSRSPEAYGILNRVRYSGQIDSEMEFLVRRNWNEMPYYYAYLFLYSLYAYTNGKRIVEQYWQNLSEEVLLEYIKYLHDIIPEEMQSVCRTFLKTTEINIYPVNRIKKNIAKYVLFSVEHQEDFEEIFEIYVEAGKMFIQSLYGRIIVDEEIIADLKNVEEAFLLYVLKSSISRNSREQFFYLDKALQHYPSMGKGIKILLKKIDTDLASTSMYDLLQQLLPQIQRMIENEMLEEALSAIVEAETIMGMKSPQLLSMKIEVYKKRLASGERVENRGRFE